MKNKRKALVLGCNFNQIPYIIELKKKYFVIGCDKNKLAPGKKLVNTFFECAYDNFKTLKKICLLNKDIQVVFSASSQFSILGVSYCNKILNKTYLKKSICNIILNKKNFYNFLHKKKIRFPKTIFIKNKRELKNKINSDKNYYLKSDHSKNPNYIYSGKIVNFYENVNWKKDRYFKKFYILQEEVVGKNIRINFVKNKLIFFDFHKLNRIKKSEMGECNFKSLEKDIFSICKDLNIINYIVKFDIIIEDKKYYFLDIGIDPPFRLKKYYKKKNKNFYQFYLKNVLG